MPGEVDLAVIVVPSTGVLEAVEACGKKGVKALVVISAGFKEIGGGGSEARERRSATIVRRYKHAPGRARTASAS